MLGRHHHLALHQPPGRPLGIGQRLLDRGAVQLVQRVQNRFLLRLFQVLDQVDHIVAVQLAHRLGQDMRRQDGDHLLADALVQLRQDLAVAFAIIKPDQPRPVIGVDLFQQVGDIGLVQRLHQLDQLVAVVDVDGIENRRHRLAVQRIGAVLALLLFGQVLGVRVHLYPFRDWIEF